MKRALIYSLKVWLITVFLATVVSAYDLYFGVATYSVGNFAGGISIRIIGTAFFALRIVIFLAIWAGTILYINRKLANIFVRKLCIVTSALILSIAILFLPHINALLYLSLLTSVWDTTYVVALVTCVALFKLPK
jgi:hypothetical protein